MRTLFLLLLLLNLALLGWIKGMFGAYPVNGREPGRLERQVAPDRVRMLTDRDVQQLQRRAAQAPAPDALACLEIGDFPGDGQLERLRGRLAALKLADRASELTQENPGWYRVYLPPARSLAEAEGRAAELREQGVRDLLILKDEGALRYAISLGSFRDRDLARKQLALLERRGIKGARVADNPTVVRSTRVRIRGADAASAKQLEELQKDFPQQKVQPCGPEATS